MDKARSNPFELSPGAHALLAGCLDGSLEMPGSVWRSGAVHFHPGLVRHLSDLGWVQNWAPYITEAGRVRLALSEGDPLPYVALGIEETPAGWWVTARWTVGDDFGIGMVARYADMRSGSSAVRGYNESFR
jgi:hypothetical protein